MKICGKVDFAGVKGSERGDKYVTVLVYLLWASEIEQIATRDPH
jgi:hypothetical protein